jgi:hypothetical protein
MMSLARKTLLACLALLLAVATGLAAQTSDQTQGQAAPSGQTSDQGQAQAAPAGQPSDQGQPPAAPSGQPSDQGQPQAQATPSGSASGSEQEWYIDKPIKAITFKGLSPSSSTS